MQLDLKSASAAHRRLLEALQVKFPDDDPEELAEYIEGETDLPEILAALVRQIFQAEADAEACDIQIKRLQERRNRFKDKQQRLRDLVQSEMEAGSIVKLAPGDLTASLRKVAPSVIITDERHLPEVYRQWKWTPDKKALLNDLKGGEEISGAVLSNGGQTLSIRGS